MSLAHTFGVLTLAVVTASPVFAQNQQQSPPPAPSSQNNQSSSDSNKQAAPPAKKPSTADENPFPEDISRKAAQGDTSTPDAPPTSAHPTPGSTTPPRSSDPATGGPATGGESSSRSKFDGLGDMTDTPDRISNGAGGYILNPKMAADDVKVGGFYMDRHDYKGAYARYKEASLVDPGNADAIFGLAEAARGLNHRDEAIQNYHLYLEALPDSKKAKDARKALAAMNAPESSPQK